MGLATPQRSAWHGKDARYAVRDEECDAEGKGAQLSQVPHGRDFELPVQACARN